MKKKILIGFGIFAILAVLALNINLSKNSEYGNTSIQTMVGVAQAQSESGGYDYYCMTRCPNIGITWACTSHQTAWYCRPPAYCLVSW